VTDLSPEARALFDAGRRSLQPTADDRERILAALSGQIPGQGGSHGGGAPSGAAATGFGWRALTGLAVGVGVVGAVVVGLRWHEPAPVHSMPSESRSSAPVVAAPLPPALAVAPVASDAPAADTLAPSPSKHAGTSAASDRLAEEVAILSEAERDLHAGQYQSALRLLDEHQRKFPHGTLTQERVAARVQALCGLGRVKEAERALGRLSPNSPHEGTAKAACATKAQD